MTSYVELHCKSNFSFLEGASHSHELVNQAQIYGYKGLAITDRNTLSGIVRAHTAAKDHSLRFVVGCELHPIDGPALVVWPSNRQGYGDLCKLLSIGRLRAPKGSCEISWHDVAGYSKHWLGGLIPSGSGGRSARILESSPLESSPLESSPLESTEDPSLPDRL